MAGTNLISAREVLERALAENPEFANHWERTALARAVANALVGYRIAHNLTQAELGGLLGMKQPRIARLEEGEHNPTWETLWKLSRVLGLSFVVSLQPFAEQSIAPEPPGAYVERFGSSESGVKGIAAVGAAETTSGK